MCVGYPHKDNKARVCVCVWEGDARGGMFLYLGGVPNVPKRIGISDSGDIWQGPCMCARAYTQTYIHPLT